MTTTSSTQRVLTKRITFFVALAVFAQESTWNLYDSQVPPLLREHLGSAALIGLLMGMDNVLGIFIQPWMGNRSDRTRTSWGRRMPYLLVGMPVAALLFLAIPHAAASLPLLILTMFGYALVANSFKPIAESLLPDFVPPERRSRANAVVKIAASLTVMVAALISIFLIDTYPKLSFAIPAILMVVSLVVLAANVRDSRSPAYQAALDEEREQAAPAARVRDTVLDIVRDTDRSRLLLIVAIFLFSGAWAASRSLITPYGMEVLGLSRGEAGGLTLPSGVAFIVAAYPVARLAERFGRLRVMTAGMTVFAAGAVLATVVRTPTGVVAGLCVASAGASAFLVNAVVVLWNLAPSTRLVGTYTGLYTVGWVSGGFLGPAVVGGLVDLTGWPLLLLHVAIVALLAVLAVGRVSARQRRSSAGRAL
ncbi:major facilitator transporter [Amycolatopsis mediterranei S699]|uniref:Major facilitator transporter n=2 Tax=Amycolatopsis mediterranei TaxID=33910 RepID=A0A0H3DAN0_AMYMU|nr:MFS transporter [Amycolatopsis mediterranei]ADJ47143.1 major facilitator transporter [Amycolatopsis mediterranei U32]AEK43966.1 major facilitator transporter [Amycolatopsis mediterranei S699]AFO78854.1 major facilitator transporter [Amycolatopsis mediterranei S699]AGT85982.1 major facilitator transporter [Amycolatopsis mediterranei RB]KDO04510.1 MFS transporter [Amycolatopsis mediterranei]